MSASGSAPSCLAVRIVGIILTVGAVLVFPSCWVESVRGLNDPGWFNADNDQVYDPAFLGTWTVAWDKCTTTLTVRNRAESKDYSWETKGVGEDCDKDSYYDAQLFKFEDHQFLDLTARPEDVCALCRAVHWIFLLQIEKDSFTLTPIDSDALKNAVERGAAKISTAQDDTDMITASAKELKAFCRKYANDKEIFKPIPGLTFKRKQP